MQKTLALATHLIVGFQIDSAIQIICPCDDIFYSNIQDKWNLNETVLAKFRSHKKLRKYSHWETDL